MTTTTQNVNPRVVKAMEDVVKVYKCCLKLPEYNHADKIWCKGELEMITNGLRDSQGEWSRFHIEYRVDTCMSMEQENNTYNLGLSDKFMDLMKAAYAPVVYELLKELPTLKRLMADFNYEFKLKQYQGYRKYFFRLT